MRVDVAATFGAGWPVFPWQKRLQGRKDAVSTAQQQVNAGPRSGSRQPAPAWKDPPGGDEGLDARRRRAVEAASWQDLLHPRWIQTLARALWTLGHSGMGAGMGLGLGALMFSMQA